MIINNTPKLIALMDYLTPVIKMCLKQTPVFLHRFIYVLQIFGLIVFNKQLKTNCLRKAYFTLRTICQWIILMCSTFPFYTGYFSHSMSAEEISVVALWVATILHYLSSTIIISRGQKMIMHTFSEMERITQHCIQKPSFKLCRILEVVIYILGAAMLAFAYIVSIKYTPTDLATQAIYANNILSNYINILVEQIVLMYIFFVSSVVRSITTHMSSSSLHAEHVKCFRRIYRDLCILSMYVDENFGIILTSCVTFSQLQCWVDMLMFIRRTSYEAEVNDIGGIMFIIATFYHIFLTYLLCWFCEDIENQAIK